IVESHAALSKLLRIFYRDAASSKGNRASCRVLSTHPRRFRCPLIFEFLKTLRRFLLLGHDSSLPRFWRRPLRDDALEVAHTAARSHDRLRFAADQAACDVLYMLLEFAWIVAVEVGSSLLYLLWLQARIE